MLDADPNTTGKPHVNVPEKEDALLQLALKVAAEGALDCLLKYARIECLNLAERVCMHCDAGICRGALRQQGWLKTAVASC